MTTHIVPCSVNDVAELSEISIETFTQTFADENDPVDLIEFTQKSYAPSVLLKELEEPNSQFFFAKIDGFTAGYLKINFGSAQTEPMDSTSMEIQRIYVRSSFKRQRIGTALMNYALDIGKTLRLNTIWLGVWEHNHKALQFYRRNNFETFSSHTFMVGKDEQTDLLMKRPIDLHK